MMTRRLFLKQLCATSLLAASPALFASKSADQLAQRIFYTAGTDHEGKHYAIAFDQEAKLLFATVLPDRAHSIIVRPDNRQIVVIARRPRQFMMVLDALNGNVLQQIDNSLPLYGHGVFSKHQDVLFVTENDFSHKQGVIGVHDVNDGYRKIDQFPSAGIGPHEIRLLSDQKTLVVANGGILTHPDTDRAKLNLDTMQPSLAYLDTGQGKLVDKYQLEEKYHQLSIRHLDVNAKDEVCFAMQYQGPRKHRFPLVGFHRGTASLQLTELPKQTLKKMKNYCGSVAADVSGEQFAVSSPRGSLITYWHQSGKFLGQHKVADGCGIAMTGRAGEYYVTNGTGDVYRSTEVVELKSLNKHEQYRWDNHLTINHILAASVDNTAEVI